MCGTNKTKDIASKFAKDEDGAVTVDWVVLTAGVVGLALMVANMLAPVLFEQAGAAIANDVTAATSR